MTSLAGLNKDTKWNCQTGFPAAAIESGSNVQFRDIPKVGEKVEVKAPALNVICQREGGRIKDIKANGSATIEYNDIRKWNDTKTFYETDYVQGTELIRKEETHQLQTSTRKKAEGVKTIYTVDHEIQAVTLKRWVQKTRKVQRPHNCIVQKTVQKEHTVDTQEVKIAQETVNTDSYEWVKSSCTENLYPEPQFHVEECWVRPRQEILTFPDTCTMDYTLREVIVYDVKKDKLAEKDANAANSATGSRFVKDLPPKMKTNTFDAYNRKHVVKPVKKNKLSLEKAQRTLKWEETEYFIKQTTEEVEETYWVEEEYTVSQLVPVIKTKKVDVEYDEPALETKTITTEVEQNCWKQRKTEKTAEFTLYENVLREVTVDLHKDCDVISRDIHKEKINSDLAQKLDNLRVSGNVAMTLSGLGGNCGAKDNVKALTADELTNMKISEISAADHLAIFGIAKDADADAVKAARDSHLAALGLHAVNGKLVKLAGGNCGC